MFTKFYYCVFVYFVVSMSIVRAQTTQLAPIKTVNIVSPESSAIPLYHFYPVDYVSGMPNIEIPLFEIDTKIAKIPFTLSYHVGKIKPSELTGIAGFGWTLTPNIGITRSIMGTADGLNKGFTKNLPLNDNTSYYGTQSYLQAAAAGNYDEQPDDFFYSLLNGAGSFIYNNSASFTTNPFAPIKIDRQDDKSFTIVNSDGTRYIFGKQQSTVAHEYVEWSRVNQEAGDIVSWKIREIISWDKTDTIKFEYGTVKQVNEVPFYNFQYKILEFPNTYDVITGKQKATQIYRSSYTSSPTLPYGIGYEVCYPQGIEYGPQYPQNFYAQYSVYHYFPNVRDTSAQFTVTNSLYNIGLNSMGYGTSYSSSDVLSKHASDQLFLSSISGKNFNVQFVYEQNRLHFLHFKDKLGNIIKSVKLYQRKLTNSHSQPVLSEENLNKNPRYCLDSVEISVGQEEKLTYRIGYKHGTGETRLNSTFGTYINFYSDPWGYFKYYPYEVPKMSLLLNKYNYPTTINNGNSGTPMVGTTQRNLFFKVGVDFEAVDNYLPSGLISWIKYPTGGMSEFKFEPNVYGASATSTKIVTGAGYRIKSIKMTDGNSGNTLVKTYKYGMNENGIGYLRYKLYDMNFLSQQYLRHYTSATTWEDNLQTIIRSKPNLSLSYGNGAPILYSKVAEYIEDENTGSTLGKTVYSYDVANGNHTNFYPMTTLQADYRDGWKEYKLKKIEQFQLSGDTLSRLNSRTLDYTMIGKDTVRVASTYENYISDYTGPGFEIAPVQKYPRIQYNITTGVIKLTKEVDSVFSSSGTLIKSIENTFDPITLFLQKVESKSSGEATVVDKKYYSKNYTGVTGLSTVQKNLLQNYISINKLDFVFQDEKIINSKLVYQSKVELGLLNTIPRVTRVIRSKDGVAANLLQSVIGNYDKLGNPVEVTAQQAPTIVYVWGYGGQYPIAEVKNASYATVLLALTQLTIDNLNSPNKTEAEMEILIKNAVGKLRTDPSLSQAMITSYTYKPLVGMTSKTDERGITEYYQYDGMYRLNAILDQSRDVMKTLDYNYRPN